MLCHLLDFESAYTKVYLSLILRILLKNPKYIHEAFEHLHSEVPHELYQSILKFFFDYIEMHMSDELIKDIDYGWLKPD